MAGGGLVILDQDSGMMWADDVIQTSSESGFINLIVYNSEHSLENKRYTYNGGTSWCTLTNWTHQGSEASFTISWLENTGTNSRLATFTFRDSDTGEEVTLTIEQLANTVIEYYQTVSPLIAKFSVNGGSSEHTLSTNRPSGTWSFKKIANGISANINGNTLTLTADPRSYNPTVQPKIQTITPAQLFFSHLEDSKNIVTSISSGSLGSYLSDRAGIIQVYFDSHNAGEITTLQYGYSPENLKEDTIFITNSYDWINTEVVNNIINISVDSNVGIATIQPSLIDLTTYELNFIVGGGVKNIEATISSGLKGTSTPTRSGEIIVNVADSNEEVYVEQQGYTAEELLSENLTITNNNNWISTSVNNKLIEVTTSTNLEYPTLSLNLYNIEVPSTANASEVIAYGSGNTETRNGFITISCGNVEKLVNISQEGKHYEYRAYQDVKWITSEVIDNIIKINVTENLGSPVLYLSNYSTTITSKTATKSITCYPSGVTQRSGRVYVRFGENDEKSILVTQQAANYNYIISSDSNWLTYSQNNNTINVLAESNESLPTLELSKYNDTISATDTSYSITCYPNNGNTDSRTGTITINYGVSVQTYTVNQSGKTNNPKYSISSDESWAIPNITNNILTIKTDSNIAYPDLSVDVSNIHFTYDGGSYIITCSTNDGDTYSRSAIISISYGDASQEFNLTQLGNINYPKYIIENNYSWIQTSRNYNKITIQANSNITTPDLSLSDSNIYFTASGGYKQSTIYTYGDTELRNSNIIINYGGSTKSINITQEGYTPTLFIDTNKSWLTTDVQNNILTIYCASNEVEALETNLYLSSYNSTSSQLGETGYFTTFYNGYNNSSKSRSGIITISYADINKTITIKQEGDSISTSLSVYSNVPWLTVRQDGDIIYWTTTTNTSSKSREGTITVTYGEMSKTFIVTQQGAQPITFTMIGDNKLATRYDFNSQIRSYYSKDVNRIITGKEINNMTWTSGLYTYRVTLKNSYNDRRCAICSDIQCTYNYTN